MKFNKIKNIVTVITMVLSCSAFAQINKAEIVATGLTCSMCSNAINKQLQKIAEVDSVAIDLNTNTFVVYFKKENKLKPRVLKESVEKAGFFIGSLTLTVSTEYLKKENSNVVSIDNSTFIFLSQETTSNDAEAKIKIYDKGYVTQKEYKKLLKTFSKTASYPIENEDDYHIKVII